MGYILQTPPADSLKDDLVGLWGRNLPQAGASRFDWLYGSGMTRAWALATESGSLVGATGMMQRRMKFGEEFFDVGNAIDLNVDREHRTVGPALQLQRALTQQARSSANPIVYAIPGPEALAVQKRVGYRHLGQLVRWARPLRTAEKLVGHLKSKLLARCAGSLVDTYLWLRSGEPWYHQPPGFRTRLVTQFDSRFDDLWRIGSRQFPIIGERTSDYLNWRFCRCPDADYRIFTVEDADESVVGYAVSLRDGKFWHMSDLFFADIPVLNVVLAEYLQHARDEGAHVVSLMLLGGLPVVDLLEVYGFRRRSDERQVLVYINPDLPEEQATQILDPQRWYLTKADGDTDI